MIPSSILYTEIKKSRKKIDSYNPTVLEKDRRKKYIQGYFENDLDTSKDSRLEQDRKDRL